jgi:hypothetical protein
LTLDLGLGIEDSNMANLEIVSKNARDQTFGED